MNIDQWNSLDESQKKEFIRNYDENEEFSMRCEICGDDMTRDIEIFSRHRNKWMIVKNIGHVIHPTREELIESVKKGTPKLPYQICRICYIKIKPKEKKWKISPKYYTFIEEVM